MATAIRDISLYKRVADIIREFTNLKGSQGMGNDTRAIIESYTTSQYDFSVTATGDGGDGHEVMYVYFIPDNGKRVNGNLIFHISTDPAGNNPASQGEFNTGLQDLSTVVFDTSKIETRYGVNAYNLRANGTLYFKAYYYSPDTGNMEVTSEYKYY